MVQEEIRQIISGKKSKNPVNAQHYNNTNSKTWQIFIYRNLRDNNYSNNSFLKSKNGKIELYINISYNALRNLFIKEI